MTFDQWWEENADSIYRANQQKIDIKTTVNLKERFCHLWQEYGRYHSALEAAITIAEARGYVAIGELKIIADNRGIKIDFGKIIEEITK
jgi:hypothetical protein